MIYKKTSIQKMTMSLALALALLVGFSTTASAVSTAPTVTKSTETQLSKVITNSGTAISKRIDDLNALSAKINNMRNVSDDQKSSLSSEIQTQITNLTAIKAKIEADTDVATARVDAKTITNDYRIYALVIPQGHIVASTDRITTIVGLMTKLQTKLQTRVNDAQTAGNDVTALQTALTDITSKLSDATSQSQKAQTGVVSLVPDQGDTTVAASNKAALLSSRTSLKMATTDLQDARKDIKTIIDGLKTMKSSSTSTTTSTTTNQ